MLNHKLHKNVHLEKIRSVVQQIMMSQTNRTVLLYYVIVRPTHCFQERRAEFKIPIDFECYTIQQ